MLKLGRMNEEDGGKEDSSGRRRRYVAMGTGNRLELSNIRGEDHFVEPIISELLHTTRFTAASTARDAGSAVFFLFRHPNISILSR